MSLFQSKSLLSWGAAVALTLMAFPACSQTSSQAKSSESRTRVTKSQQDLDGLHKAYFASGCFWCVEAIFESVKGVEEAVSGYSGGTESNPRYQEVSAGRTSHAEAVEVYYDSSVVDYPTLLKVFFGSQDPTTYHRQGPDRGAQYRSVAFYQNETEKALIEAYVKQLYETGEFEPGSIVTEITAFKKFWKAEAYHQNYEALNPTSGYIQAVSIPRLKRFQAKYPELLKEGH